MQQSEENNDAITTAWRHHERRWKDHLYVYAVVSRRSRGVSVGINLNPNKACNFNCIYCQVNRNVPATVLNVDLEKLAGELDAILQAEKEGSLYEEAPFNALAPAERGVRDIAFSGDGEPTLFPRFKEAVQIAAEALRRYRLDSTRLILLTDAAYLNKSDVRAALAVMDENNGEIWAKLDAGTEAYFHKVNRSKISLDQIIENILDAARVRPLIIQSLWFRMDGAAPPIEELEAFCARLNDMIAAGGQFKALQIYTIARDPAESYVSALSSSELDGIAAWVKARVPVPVEEFR
jgi:wyosine [tRNA(Phe)-imidazoG37] synthetase (radical SAM superfamily)